MGSRQKSVSLAAPRWLIGWSILVDGSALDCFKRLQRIRTNEFWLGLEPDLKGCAEGDPDKCQCLFVQLASNFLKRICSRDCFRPLPPMLGNGQCVDWFKLFSVVKEKGGFNTITENGLWHLVAAESGLRLDVSPAVKLIFVKYLDTLERFLERFLIYESSKVGLTSSSTDSSGFLMELETEFKDFLSDISEQNKKDEEYLHLDLVKNELNCADDVRLCDSDGVKSFAESDGGKRSADDDSEVRFPVGLDGDKIIVYDENEVSCSAEFDGCKTCIEDDNEDGYMLQLNLNGGKKFVDDDIEICCSVGSGGGKRCTDDENVIILNSNVESEEICCRKRKRESLLGMLRWVAEVAKDPCDPVIGTLPERSKWKFYRGEEFWKQVLLAREALFFKRPTNSSAEQTIWQKKQKMHPSIYDDHINSGYRTTEKLRCSQRLLCVKKSQFRGCSESSLGSSSNWDVSPSPREVDKGDINIEKQFFGIPDSLVADSLSGLCGNNYVRKRIPVGPFFQANMPDWTGIASESDSKWLGTRVWPIDKKEHRFLIERDPIGKGRQDSCGCQVPNSVDCVRFHIAEKKMKVKLELGSAFCCWKFEKMGEDVGLSWTVEDKKKFEATVQSNPPSMDKCFWDEIIKIFPAKSREDLVSYYFNVFLLQRRSYQNRYTPNDIDSDDEESEFRLLNNGFGLEVKLPGSMVFAQSKPHVNFK